MTEPVQVTLAVWEIQYSAKGEGRYRYNRPVMVVASDVARALEVFTIRHPEAAVHAVQKRSSTSDFLVDPLIADALIAAAVPA